MLRGSDPDAVELRTLIILGVFVFLLAFKVSREGGYARGELVPALPRAA